MVLIFWKSEVADEVTKVAAIMSDGAALSWDLGDRRGWSHEEVSDEVGGGYPYQIILRMLCEVDIHVIKWTLDEGSILLPKGRGGFIQSCSVSTSQSPFYYMV